MKKQIATLLITVAMCTGAIATDISLDEAVVLFWDCDYAASTDSVLDMSAGAACSIAYEKVLKQKFNGDFNALVAWWKAHKKIEYKARANNK